MVYHKYNDQRENTNNPLHKAPYYLITIRKSQVLDYVTQNELIQIYHQIKSKLPFLKLYYSSFDLDSYNSLHFHFIAHVPYYFHYSCMNQINGFHIDYKRLYRIKDINYAVKYVTKNHNPGLNSRVAAHKYTHALAPNIFINR